MSQALVKGKDSRDKVLSLVEQWKPRLKDLLPRHLDVSTFQRKIMFALSKNARLFQCDPMSVISSITEAASLGLDPTGILQEGYLVPYGGRCQFQAGYRGLITLARREGSVKSIRAHGVYEQDMFDCELGMDPKLIHVPRWDSGNIEDYGKMKFAYAIAKLADGEVQFEVMPKSAIEKIRRSSKAAEDGPWVSWPVPMALKTVLRRLCKLLPASTELGRALALDDAVEGGEAIDPPVGAELVAMPESEQEPEKTSALRQRVAERAAKAKTHAAVQQTAEPGIQADETEDQRQERLAQEEAERAGI